MSTKKERKGWLGLLASLLALAILGCPKPESARQSPPQYNYLIVLIDALRADRVGVNGYPLPTTPAIDQLASEGVTFTHAFSHSTWTKPSIATLFTSLYPGRHGVREVGIEGTGGLRSEVLAPEFTTLAEHFQQAGYRTGAVLNQVHLHPRFGFAQGFEHYDQRRGTDGRRLSGRFARWLDTLETGPFFAYLHTLDVHWPYTRRVPEPQPDFGPTELSREPAKRGGPAMEAWLAENLTDADIPALQARYDHEVAFADLAVAELVGYLKERELYDDTILLITSDHGEGFKEHGRFQHGYTPYREQIHVPLILRLPEALRTPTHKSDAFVGLIDVMPTLLELAGITPTSQLQGESFATRLGSAERATDPRVLFADWRDVTAIHSQDAKLISRGDGSWEFFDLRLDPLELSPQTDACEGPCRELAQRLAKFERLLASAAKPVTDQPLMTPEELEELRTLGYL